MVWSPCSPRDSQESSTPQFKSINPWLIHVNVWQKPLQYCKVISLKLIKINEKKETKASIHRCSALFVVQLSHPYMTTGKTLALTRWTFVGKVMSLLFNILSKFVIAFLPRSMLLFISWLQLSSVVILEPKKIKSVTVSLVYPRICHEAMGLDAMILVFWILNFFSFFFNFFEYWILS